MASDPQHDPFESTRMTLGEHIEELRRRFLRSAIALALVFAGAYAFVAPLSDFVMVPLERAVTMLNEDLVELYEARLAADPTLERGVYFDPPQTQELADPIPLMPRADGAHSGFFFDIKVALMFALAVAGPYVLWQLWQFVAAGLYSHERRVMYRSVPASGLLFVGGLTFGYTVLVPYGYYFLARTTLGRIEHYPEVGHYFTFVTSLCLALGLVFQLPILMTSMARVGLILPATFARYRPHFIVGALMVSALLTPPDPITQMMMGIPMVLLYEIGLLASRVAVRRAAAVAAASPGGLGA